MIVSEVPSLNDVVQADLESTVAQLQTLPSYVASYFDDVAAQMIAEQGANALSRAFALLTGLDERLKPKSLLSKEATTDAVGTVRLRLPSGKRVSEELVREAASELELEITGPIQLSSDRRSAYFDLPADQACRIVTRKDLAFAIDMPRTLSDIADRAERTPRYSDIWVRGAPGGGSGSGGRRGGDSSRRGSGDRDRDRDRDRSSSRGSSSRRGGDRDRGTGGGSYRSSDRGSGSGGGGSSGRGRESKRSSGSYRN